MRSTMQEFPLTVGAIVRYGTAVFGDRTISTWTGTGLRRRTFAEVAERAARLAGALRGLGVRGDERVATFQWNSTEHVEAYLAVPSMGAVLHPLNVRLPAGQLAHIAGHAQDRVLIVDGSLLAVLVPLLPELGTVRHLVVAGESDPQALAEARRRIAVHDYEELLAAAEPEHGEPATDERDAAVMCYTSGTTGEPRGVVYSHRSIYLHALGICHPNVCDLREGDRVLPVVPMFHVNAWGLVHAALFAGTDLVLPGRHTGAQTLAALIAGERVTVAAGVPTIWNDLLRLARAGGADLSSLRHLISGGAATPRALMEAYERELSVTVVQGWGMTETSPFGALARPPRDTAGEERWRHRCCAGRVVPGVEARIRAEDGSAADPDGRTVGEIEVRGPWVAGSYHREGDGGAFRDGWLRTGDVGTLDERGFLRISDRAKDVIKSGGEWISSVELEDLLMAHPAVAEAAVIGIPDAKWGERPLAHIVLRHGEAADPDALFAHLASRIPRWQVPERWAFVGEIPRTSVGKFDKKVLRARYAAGGRT